MTRSRNRRIGGQWVKRGNWTGLLPDLGAPGPMRNPVATATSTSRITLAADLPETVGGSQLIGLYWRRDDPTGALGGSWTSTLRAVDSSPFPFDYLVAGTYKVEVRAVNRAPDGSERPGPWTSATATVSGGVVVTPDPIVPTASLLMAKTFVENSGICCHLGRGGPYANLPAIKNVIANSGIKALRGSWGGSQTDRRNFYAGLRRDLGVRILFWTGQIGNNLTATMNEIAATNAVQPDTIAWLEGPNEQDNDSRLRQYTIDTWNAAKANPATASLPIFGPSMANVNSSTPYANLGKVDQYLDAVNMHCYPGGKVMTDGYIDTLFGFAGNNLDLPIQPGEIMASEYGISTSPNYVLGGAHHPTQPEDARAQIIASLWLANYRRGIYPNFLYVFIRDSNPDQWQNELGLIREDFTPLPSWNNLSNLVTLLADPGPDFTPAQFSYTVTGGTNLTRTLPLYKRNGELWLVVWQEDDVFDRYARTYRNPPKPTVTVGGFPSARSRISHYVTDSKTERSVVTNATSYAVTSQPLPTLVRITP